VSPYPPAEAHLETLVDHMFDQVLEGSERAELIEWIRHWEAANPDVDNAHRITGWIDVAYAFQARATTPADTRQLVRLASWSLSTWNWAPISA
jgi:hypothetical protein